MPPLPLQGCSCELDTAVALLSVMVVVTHLLLLLIFCFIVAIDFQQLVPGFTATGFHVRVKVGSEQLSFMRELT